jgi:hypothetical protein
VAPPSHARRAGSDRVPVTGLDAELSGDRGPDPGIVPVEALREMTVPSGGRSTDPDE